MKKIFGTFILSAMLLAALFIALFKNKGSNAAPSMPEAKKFQQDRQAELAKKEQEQLEEARQLSLAEQANKQPFPIDLNSIIKSKKLALEITKKDSTDNRDIQEIDLYLAELSEKLLAKNQLVIGIKYIENYDYYIAEIEQNRTSISLTLASESKQKQINNTATEYDLVILQTEINKCNFKLKDDDGMGMRSESAVLGEYLNTRKTDPSYRK